MELTDEEVKVIELYRACTDVDFYQHGATKQEALDFTSILGRPFYEKIDESLSSYQSEEVPRKIEITAFLNDLARDEVEHEFKEETKKDSANSN